MALDDYLEPEVAVTAAVAAAVFSPKARKAIRRGAVYGLAGILVAGDALASIGKSFSRGIKEGGSAFPSPNGSAKVTPSSADVEDIPRHTSAQN